ncbi:MAG TPA: tRNA (adenosine(37)-N6)-threonylcarbamoyltransferase complex dimerization subunit type 1 TsaB [Legionella sp.]|nr:tRNA (adenosine(37)-N6)-threonylcarbamoyltransferase complex dimerization subunit type 1 TsaB [Legionella sp.]
MMTLLAIDTSTERASVALAVGDSIFYDEKHSVREHAMCLLPMVEGLLAAASLSLSQLDGIAFGCGPGSFTGLRITCSIAKALAYAHDLPLYPVSSLAAIANEVYHAATDLKPDTHVLAMLDARMQQVYWADFTHINDLPTEHVSAAEDVVWSSAAPLIIAGVGLDAYAPFWPPSLQTLGLMPQQVYPDARTMIRVVRAGNVQAVSTCEALPVYVRELQFKPVEAQ